ncbi:MAG: hypothetical protein ACU0DW_16340 [Shimia sp.]
MIKTLTAAAACAMLTLPAFAQGACAERDSLATALATHHGEAPVSGGLQGSSYLVEVFVSAEEGTWTIVATEASGKACIIAAGTDWVDSAVLPAGIPG